MTDDYVPKPSDIIVAMERLTTADPDDIRQMKIRLATKFANQNISADLADQNPNIEFAPNSRMYDIAMLTLGKVIDKKLIVDLEVFTITINLPGLISEAMKYGNINIIHELIEHNIDIYHMQPLIMPMCTQTDQYDLLSKLLDMKVPLDAMNYRTIYHLANKGKLDLLKKITENYQFDNLNEVVGKICVEAVRQGHLDILQYYLPAKIYESAPDVMQIYFYNSIIHGGHLPIVKYFVEIGCDIRMDNWQAVKVAIAHNRGEIIQYLSTVQPSICDILPTDIKQRFGLIIPSIKTKLIGKSTCSIYYQDINQNDYYYMCTFNHPHYFCKEAWESWVTKRSDWKCPVCQNNVETILYKNTN